MNLRDLLPGAPRNRLLGVAAGMLVLLAACAERSEDTIVVG